LRASQLIVEAGFHAARWPVETANETASRDVAAPSIPADPVAGMAWAAPRHDRSASTCREAEAIVRPCGQDGLHRSPEATHGLVERHAERLELRAVEASTGAPSSRGHS
jgi:hypothetical protein